MSNPIQVAVLDFFSGGHCDNVNLGQFLGVYSLDDVEWMEWFSDTHIKVWVIAEAVHL